MRPHRRSPRPLATAIEPLVRSLAPATPLARIQRCWPRLAAALPAAAEGSPTNLRGRVLTVTCTASVWAQELQLMGQEVLALLNAELGEELVRELRPRVG
jgi:predicted nucleic acid-binding Zn ribbon protein